jgi:hypothetical protein
MKLNVYFINRMEQVDAPIRLALSLLVPAAAFAGQVQSVMLFAFLALIDLLGVAFGIMLFIVDQDSMTILRVGNGREQSITTDDQLAHNSRARRRFTRI